MLRTTCRIAALAALIHGAPLPGAGAQTTTTTLADVRYLAREDGAPLRVTCTVHRPHGWRNGRNHDAVWLFAKYRTARRPAWLPARVAASGHAALEVLAGPPPAWSVPEDRAGLFCTFAEEHHGEARWRVELQLDEPQLADAGEDAEIALFALELVHVPAGPFTLGDPGEEALDYAVFFRAGEDGAPDGLVRVTSEGPLEVGPQPGRLSYRTSRPQYGGDGEGPVPAEFPKGFDAFYVMKRELTQGEYARFLNLLTDDQTAFRAIHGGRLYSTHRGTIRLEDGRYVAGRPERPCNFVSWDDGCAFADWSGLRPMTELEFTKAARGGGAPVAREFPWGTADKEGLVRRMQGGDLVREGAADEDRLGEEARVALGASPWWVLDLAGSVWERAVTIGHPRGRAFRGTHGDGRLSTYGNATNEDWPRGDDDGGGYGYRGGGYYDPEHQGNAFLPHSPIGYRRFGAWGSAPRYKAYGFRCARTAP